MSDQRSTPDPSPEPGTLPVLLHPLRWFAAEAVGPQRQVPFNADTALEWFCSTLPQRPLLPVLKARYERLTECDYPLFAFPYDQVVAEKVMIPLHQAKVAFILGYELGCIAMCGMVGEMLASLRFKMSRFGSGPDAWTPSRQERLLGRGFEHIEHSRRIQILEILGLIDADAADQFTKLARTRNKYLHRMSQSHDELAEQAIESYRLIVRLTVGILGIGVQQGQMVFNSEVLEYVRNRAKEERAREGATE